MINLTALLRAYSIYRRLKLNLSDPFKLQTSQLMALVAKAKNTTFGKDHGFSSIRSVADYQRQVPIRSYEDFWQQYWKAPFPTLRDITWPGQVPYFAVSSGTSSGATKYIPYTAEIMRATTIAGLDMLSFHLENKPDSEILGGYNFILTGNTSLVEQKSDIFSGDMSGICMKLMPKWARSRTFPPQGLQYNSWEDMIEKCASLSLNSDIRSLNGAPSWMLLLLDRLINLKPESQGKLAALFPNLELLVHGGMNFEPYRAVYSQLLEGSPAETREVYPASEGFFAVQDRGYGEGMRLILDHGIFYEFIPVSELDASQPNRCWIANVEANIDYALVVSSCAGLWSYMVGDIVRFVDTRPARVLMTGRTSYMLSAVGEHLLGEEIEKSLLSAAQDVGVEVREYSVGAQFPKNSSELVGHIFVIEFAGAMPSDSQIVQLEKKLDGNLSNCNEDYEAHRKNEFGLNPPKIIGVVQGSFAEWMKSRGKFGGQNKVPRVINNQEIFENLLNFSNTVLESD